MVCLYADAADDDDAEDSKPYCVSSGATDGLRPRKSSNTCSGCWPPPRARIVSRNRWPTRASASLRSGACAASSNAPYASHDRISAHL